MENKEDKNVPKEEMELLSNSSFLVSNSNGSFKINYESTKEDEIMKNPNFQKFMKFDRCTLLKQESLQVLHQMVALPKEKKYLFISNYLKNGKFELNEQENFLTAKDIITRDMRAFRRNQCNYCWFLRENCICSQIPNIHIQHKLIIVFHHKGN